MEPLFKLRNAAPPSRPGSVIRGGQGVGKLPGEADDSVGTDEQTRMRGARRRIFHAAHRLLIRPGDLRGRGSSCQGKKGERGGDGQGATTTEMDGIVIVLRVLSFV